MYDLRDVVRGLIDLITRLFLAPSAAAKAATTSKEINSSPTRFAISDLSNKAELTEVQVEAPVDKFSYPLIKLTTLDKDMYTRASRSDVDYNNHGDPWEKDSSSIGYDVSDLEANRYYYGIRGPRRRGPKLIFRTSSDAFTAPSGPEQEPRLMRLIPVYEHHILSKENLWAILCSKIVELLDNRNIKHSSIDLVRFGWIEEKKVNKDEEDDKDFEDFNIKVTPHETLITTPTTIWVGVLPNTVTGNVAFHSSNDILNLLKEHGISDVDIAYRESVVRPLCGPALFAPVTNINPLKAVIDPVTTALSLPIAGLTTLQKQGTMGFYFRVGEDHYAVTARHILFPEDEENGQYEYTGGPKREVVLMGTDTFNTLMESIKERIDTITDIEVNYWEKRAQSALKRLEGGGFNADFEQEAKLMEAQNELREAGIAIKELKKLFDLMEKQWAKPKDRVIGHVVWAPPISTSTAPHNYMRDVCVVKLDKKKFSENFRGNVLDLGPEIDPIKFVQLMKPHTDYEYPDERLLKIGGILSAAEICSPNGKGHRGKPIRYVIKRGSSTLTTIGRLSGFESHVRRYSILGDHDSVEAAIYPYDNTSGPFSKGGDSGSIIVNPCGKFVALLTGGAGPTDGSDITYGSPIHWLWEVIREKFPSANLYFEDDDT